MSFACPDTQERDGCGMWGRKYQMERIRHAAGCCPKVLDALKQVFFGLLNKNIEVQEYAFYQRPLIKGMRTRMHDNGSRCKNVGVDTNT